MTRTAEAAAERPADPEASETGEVQSVRPFGDFLREYQQGELHDEISEELRRVIHAVQMVGKPGTVVLKVTVKKAGRSPDQVVVSADIDSKLPHPEREDRIYFIDRDGNLTLNNPRQLELPPLRRVRGGANASAPSIQTTGTED